MKSAWISARSQQPAWQLLGVVLASMTLWLGCASTSSPVTCELPHIPKPDLPERGISAHRGGLLGCPVNTIGAFQRAICRGVHQIELDVRATADDVIVIAHDDLVTDADGHTLRISESTLTEVQELSFRPCTGEVEKERIPTLGEALAIMPQNLWINVDIKNNDPRMAKLVAETVAKAHRFNQVIFATRDKAAPAVRQVAREAGTKSWVANMSREFFRCQYVDATINSCAEFIQLVEVPYLPFVRGKPSQDIMYRLKEGGVRVNYSWLREESDSELRRELRDLFNRGVDFVLVDHVGQAMEAACAMGIAPLVPRWNDRPPFICSDRPPRCTPAL